MKTIVIISALLFGGVAVFEACNFISQAKAQSPTYVRLQPGEAAKLGQQTIRVDKTSGFAKNMAIDKIAYGALNQADAKTLLNRVNLEKLISSKQGEDYVSIFNGFMGKDYYRIEFFVDQVTYDKENPFVVNITGKTRYKKNITPFTGTVTIDSVLYFAYTPIADGAQYSLPEKPNVATDSMSDLIFHTKGSFAIEEDKTLKGAGTFGGKFYMDFMRDSYSNEEGFRIQYGQHNETKNGGLLLDGQFTYYADNKSKPMIASPGFFMFANDILRNFTYGEREMEINEKYRAAGWDDYWENKEWWSTKAADAPQQEPNTQVQ